ncbi:MAG TPA: phospholipid carrier-dependent glycosyltransferase [Terriglobia bacterium]|nr:phospholipid carrier-dependent glycosyltransferase [Terriglobia bacterium]
MNQWPDSSKSPAEPASPAWRHLLLLGVVAACLFFVGLGRLPLLEPDEGRNAEVAREMAVGGDWITPHFDSLPYLDKPALYFWLVAGSFRMFGASEWAARMPSALAALATLLLAWFLARRMSGRAASLGAGIVLAASPLFVIFARQVIFDMTLAFFVTLAMTCFWLVEESRFTRPWLELVLFASSGLAAITKGPVGFLLPFLSILAYEAIRGRMHDLKKLRWGRGLAVFCAASLPWFLAVSIRHPDFPRYAFWDESLLRFASGHAHRGGGPFYYIPVFLGGFLPWSFLLVFVAWNRRRRWKELRQEGSRPTVFLLAWVGVIFLFFSISQSKLPGYVLPATIPLSILMAQAWREVSEGDRRPDWLTAGFAALMLLGLLTAASPQLLRVAALQHRAAEKLPPATLAMLAPSLLYSGMILVALGILGRHLARHTRGRTAWWTTLATLALVFPLLLLRWIAPLRSYAAADSSRELAETIQASSERDLPVYAYHYFRTGLPFYLGRPVTLVTADGAETTSNYVVSRYDRLQHQQSSAGGAIFTSDAQLEARARSTPLLVLVRDGQAAALTGLIAGLEPLWTSWQYSVWETPGQETPAR